MSEETHGVTREPYSIEEKREMLGQAAETKEAADAIGELSDEQVETAFEEHVEKNAAAEPGAPLAQPAEAQEPSTGAHIERAADSLAVEPDAPKPTVGRIVLVAQEIGGRRSTSSVVSVPAIVTGTSDHPEGAFGLELDSPWHVHLTVFEPGAAEGYSATNMPWDGTGLEHGTWRWPERV